VILWSVAERKPVGETLSGFHREGISAVTLSPDGTVLASAGGDGAVLLYDLERSPRPIAT
jgi:WD40 repeat protein